MSTIQVSTISPLSPGGTVNFTGASPPTFEGNPLRDLISIADFGDVVTSPSIANATFATAMAAIGSSGGIVNPKGSLVDFTTLTVPNGVIVFDLQGQRVIASGVATGKSVQAGGGHLLIQNTHANTATRVHEEPNGFVAGTAAKFDLMFDPYEADGANGYRILNLYTKNYDLTDGSTLVGNNGVGVLGLKGVGKHFGIFPALHVGFMDDGATSATPFKMYYFDTGDSAWRTPLLGAWRPGISVTSGDYILASFHLYQAGNTAVTGATIPSHTSGTVSDGGVNWLFVRDYQATSGGFRGCVVIGDRDDLPVFGLPSVRMQVAQDVAVWNGKKVRFLDNTNASSWSVFTNGLTDDLYIETEDGQRRLRLDSTGKFLQLTGMAYCTSALVITDNTTTPDVSGCEKVIINNASVTSITQLRGLPPHAKLIVTGGNTNTTLVHNSTAGSAGSPTLCLIGGVNKTLSPDCDIELRLNISQTQWIEVGKYTQTTLTLSGLATTPSVAGAENINFNNASGTSVTSLTGGTPYGKLIVMSSNGFTTLVHNATAGSVGVPTIATNTNANKTLTAGSCLEFRLNSAGTQWIELGRL